MRTDNARHTLFGKMILGWVLTASLHVLGAGLNPEDIMYEGASTQDMMTNLLQTHARAGKALEGIQKNIDELKNQIGQEKEALNSLYMQADEVDANLQAAAANNEPTEALESQLDNLDDQIAEKEAALGKLKEEKDQEKEEKRQQKENRKALEDQINKLKEASEPEQASSGQGGGGGGGQQGGGQQGGGQQGGQQGQEKGGDEGGSEPPPPQQDKDKEAKPIEFPQTTPDQLVDLDESVAEKIIESGERKPFTDPANDPIVSRIREGKENVLETIESGRQQNIDFLSALADPPAEETTSVHPIEEALGEFNENGGGRAAQEFSNNPISFALGGNAAGSSTSSEGGASSSATPARAARGRGAVSGFLNGGAPGGSASGSELSNDLASVQASIGHARGGSVSPGVRGIFSGAMTQSRLPASLRTQMESQSLLVGGSTREERLIEPALKKNRAGH